MSKKAQGGSGTIGLVVIVIVVIAIAYLYYAGYISLPSSSTTTYQPSAIPINVTASSTAQISNLYPSQSFNVVATIASDGASALNVSIIGYGCGSTPSTKYVEVYPRASTSSTWTFSAPGTGSCDIQFTSCFNDVSYANYPITVENQTFTGTPPVNLPSSSIAPVSVSLSGVTSVVTAPPSATNQTMYILASPLSAGYIKNSTLNWLNIDMAGTAFIELPSGSFLTLVGRSYNITNTNSPGALYVNGKLQLPVEITFSPVTQSSGFTTNTDMNISVGYTYCLTSNLLPVSVS